MSNESRLNRLSTDLNNYAGEAVAVEQIGSMVYAYGSELATLRILKKYWNCTNVKQGYSENLSTHYFRIEV